LSLKMRFERVGKTDRKEIENINRKEMERG
jgi:hypothetical protein